MSDNKAELALLKEQATKLGIAYSPNIGYATLKKKIDAKLAETSEPTEEVTVTPVATVSTGSKKMEMLKLVHVIITNLDPNDRESKGEYFTFCNKIVGKVSRMVPFGKPWHVEKCLLDSIRDSKFVNITQDNNQPPVKTLSKKYDIEILPPLTQEELDKLAKAQLAGNRIDN